MFSHESLITIKPSPVMQRMATENTRKEQAEALAALDNALASPHYNGRMPYICLGCQIGEGDLRQQIIGFAAYPLYQVIAEQLLHHKLALQAYHPQAQEEGADPGPGGVVGLKALGCELDTTASTAAKMWHWVNPATNFAYKDEDAAEEELWTLTQQRCGEALHFLSQLTDEQLRLPVFYRYHLRHQMHTLLGITAVRRLVNAKLCKRLVLIDQHRLIAEKHLIWEHFYQ